MHIFENFNTSIFVRKFKMKKKIVLKTNKEINFFARKFKMIHVLVEIEVKNLGTKFLSFFLKGKILYLLIMAESYNERDVKS